ncbi:4-hydroxybenzoate octaprenyltransferase [Solimonas sp. K1W22B-7]|uniref:4-hydroxybenzoate octaprenyltransferase n=1 Tax=Solimonas sp. K1W22B-7 TaxID=2303331 RepID=UPI000E32E1F5|nr:4-hydroxybenzoate octaprenyltransferase [Solimonas sp. K1W22B-7]AXQ27668.1 4-hydroxybenzoate octaprenyltransferase [Solimonas sp. K1W22B-7]
MRAKLADYARLMRLDRPIGIYLLLWPTLWALWFAAGGLPPGHVLLVFVLGTVLMRSAGCAINDFADRDFDPHVARTRERPLAAGRVSPREALILFAGVCLLALALLLSLGNLQVVLWSVPAVLLAAAYPFMKRWISIPQAVLGLAFSWGIPMAWAALGLEVDWARVLPLMAANIAWVIAYDTWYAMVDREDDLKLGVKSAAILFGRHDRLVIALLQGGALLLLIQLGQNTGRGEYYNGGIAVASMLAVYQQWITRGREPARCFQAFLNNHWFGAAIFIGLALDYVQRA